MPKLRLILSETAISDMTQIFDYISKDNTPAAKKLLMSFSETFERLRNFPNSGFKKAEYINRNVRISIVAGHYQVIYSVDNEHLYIQRILSGYQDICSKL